MNEKEIITSWNEAVELYKSNPDDHASIRQARDQLKTVISSYPKQGVSKLCYNVAILSRLLGDNATDLEVGTLFQYLLV